MRTLAACALLLLAGIAIAAHAEERGTADKALSPGITLLPGEIPTAQFSQGVPDLGYDPSWEWQALVCSRGCELVAVKLRMTAVKVSQYDGGPLPGHVYSVEGKATAKPLALLRGLEVARATPRTWLHAGLAQYPPSSTPGTMEIDIPADGDGARVVPRYAGEIHGTPTLKIYLETRTHRQLLGQIPVDAVVGPSALPRGPQLLRWAGDLDADGKLDLLMSFSHRYGTDAATTLFLSSKAKDGQLVGQAADFSYWPVNDPGC
jgi:hypothetical protein